MQNKPNFKRAKMNVNIYYTNVYENISDWTLGQNKPNQSQFQTAHLLIDTTKRIYYYGIW